MPLIAAAFIAHAAGLLLGFGGVSLFGMCVAAAVGSVAAIRRDARLGALVLLAVAGLARASVAGAADAQCARRTGAGSVAAGEAIVLTGIV